MQKIGGNVLLSSVDLVGHLNCRFLTGLDLKVANGELDPSSPFVALLLATLDKFSDSLSSLPVDAVIAAATSPMRTT